MSKRQAYLDICAAQVGVTENPPGSNNVKYNTAYYGYPVSGSGYAWCAAAIWWCMREAGCADLYYGGKKTAYVPTLYQWAKDNGQFVQDPQPGDWVLFDWDKSGLPDHIGTVETVNATTITTLEGNVNDAYKRLIRQRDSKIMGYIRPRWPADPEPQPEPDYVEPFVDVPKSAWYAKAVRWDYDHGIVTGTDKTHFSPNKDITRAEVAQMIYKAVKPIYDDIEKLKKRIEALEKGGG